MNVRHDRRSVEKLDVAEKQKNIKLLYGGIAMERDLLCLYTSAERDSPCDQE